MTNSHQDYSPLLPAKQQLLRKLLLERRASRSAPPSQMIPHLEQEYAPLSFAQQRLWFLEQLGANHSPYNMSGANRLHGSLHLEVLEKSVQGIMRRHVVLRTVFVNQDGHPLQHIRDSLDVTISLIDLAPLSVQEQEHEISRLVRSEPKPPFDLVQGPLFRLTLLRLQDDEHILLATFHHIIADAWSLRIFTHELSEFYTTLCDQHGSVPADQVTRLPDLPFQYADFARWQREWLQGESFQKQLDYWRQQLARSSERSQAPFLHLPTDRPRPAIQSFPGARLSRLLSPDLHQQLKSLSQRENVTLFMMGIAAFQVLLMRYSGQPDIVVGSPIAHRTREELEGLIGFFVNMLVLRTDLSGNPTFRQLLGRVRQVVVQAYAHQDVPFEKLVEDLQPERDLSYQPLFQVSFNMLDVPASKLEIPDVTFHPMEVEQTTSQFDLSLSLNERGSGPVPDGLLTTLEYNTDLFDATTMERLLEHWQVLLEAIVRDPAQPIETLPLLTESELHRLLVEWNNTARNVSHDLCLHQLIEQQVEQTPDAIAVIGAGLAPAHSPHVLTYRELNARTNQLAHRLQEIGIGPEKLVAVCMQRSPELVVALLAILKAGGAYLPLDPAYPAERLAWMLTDAQPTVVLTQQRLSSHLPNRGQLTLCLDRDWEALAAENRTNPVNTALPEQTAYVIYTSGSTGTPKGVMVSHRNVVNFFRGMDEHIGGPTPGIWLAVTSISFDISVLELFWTLIRGFQVVLHTPLQMETRGILSERWIPNNAPDPHVGVGDEGFTSTPSPLHHAMPLAYLSGDTSLPTQLLEYGVSHLQCTPSLMHMLLMDPLAPTALQGLSHLLLGGEELPLALVKEIQARTGHSPIQLHNMYGPTETTIWSTTSVIEPNAEEISLGGPIANTQVYLLDTHLQSVPIGVAGEIYMSGEGLAHGYLNRGDLTAERFLPNPWDKRSGGRLYRTGDVARYHEDGLLEYLGRRDQQVKLRGHRIELGEIEANLRAHPTIQEAVVVLRELSGVRKRTAVFPHPSAPFPHEKPLSAPDSKYLIAYVVPVATSQEAQAGESPTAAEAGLPSVLQRYLRQQLPDYMVPSRVVVLETMPLTYNGKVDRNALPIPERILQHFGSYVAPRSELEQRLSDIWQEVLGKTSIGISNNFFDLGGHSLLLIQVQNKLETSLGYRVSVVDLFHYPTIHALATYLSGQQEQQPLQPPPQPIVERVRKRKAALSTEELLASSGGIAIVGVAGRFPGARNIDEFWQNLCNGVESISFFTEEELLASGVEPELIHDPRYVKAHGILDDIESFDAAFFGYSPKEAAMLDPQQRLFLECAWEVLEQAGYDPGIYQGLIGVYAGQSASSYLISNVLPNRPFLAETGTFPILINNDKDFLATRTSYKLNLKGPGITIQTACSTSLVAVHMACQGLLRYECDMALAGGASLLIPQKMGYLYEEDGILSPDGHCRAFDADARGTVGGSGVGIVALKRLSDALNDGDSIYAVIRGSAINNDGAAKVGYTAPSVEGQINVITEAIAMADIEPETISYVETHGTGTTFGDSIEIAALTQAFRSRDRSASLQDKPTGRIEAGRGQAPSGPIHRRSNCAIGSVKTNLGHLDATAGIAGLIKTVLALKHGMLPPSLHCHHPNPKIDFAQSPFYVNTHLTAWNTENKPRRAGVSSFGIGGTNAHVILEEAPESVKDPHPSTQPPSRRPLRDAEGPHLVVLSAKTASALETMTQRLATYVKTHPDAHLADMAYTLQIGRKSFPYRRAFVAQERTDMLHLLETLDPPSVSTSFVSPETKPVAFLFPGQGTQYINMGRELYEKEPTFRQQVETCARLLAPDLQRDLREIIYPTTAHESGEQLHQTEMTQPAIFVIEYALAQLLMKWGIHPQAMIGHSIGEYVAACLAGVFDLPDALALVALRGRLMQALPVGAMLSIILPEKEVQKFLGERIALAACNGANESVVSGTVEAIELLEKHLREKDISSHRLHTSHAFHSQMMDPILERFTSAVSKRALHPPKIPYISNITGTWITDQEATNPAYWTQHLRQTVRFTEGIQLLLDIPNMVLLEVGPGQSLSTLARRAGRTRAVGESHIGESSSPLHVGGSFGTMPTRSGELDSPTNRLILSSLRHPQTLISDRAFLLNTCGRLWCTGVAIDWSQFPMGSQPRRIPLPTYPFERQRYWISPMAGADRGFSYGKGSDGSEKPLFLRGSQGHQESASLQLRKEPDLAQWFSAPSWKRSSLPPVQVPPPAEGETQVLGTDLLLMVPGPKSCWLIFTDTIGLGTRLVSHLREQGETALTVRVGAQFGRVNDWEYTIRPESGEDYGSLLRDMSAHNLFPSHIVHTWTVMALDQISSGLDHFETTQTLGFYSLLNLTQALGEQKGEQPQEIAIISNNLQEVIGREMFCPARATALGVGKIAPYEYPHLTFRNIDIVLPLTIGQPQTRSDSGKQESTPPPVPTDEEQLVDQMIAELRSHSSDMTVAYRGPHRWVQYIEPVRLEKVSEEKLPREQSHERLQGKTQGLRQQGVYLITGGLGNIGLTLSECLAQQVRARLVLTGRTALPAREEWDRRLATQVEQDAVVRKIRRVKRLEELGAEVLVLQADVTDLEQMQEVITQVRQNFGALHGVIHAAGLLDDGLIQMKRPAVAAKVLAPKVQGTLVLEAVLKDVQFDFLILFSSLAALIGELGHVDYCAANTFLDSFAFYHTAQQRVRTVSINWDSWQEMDVAANALSPSKKALLYHPEIQKRFQNGISPQEGVEAFRRIIAYRTPSQLIVSTSDIQARLRQAESFLLGGQAQDTVPTTLHQRPNLQTVYVAPQNETQQQIVDLWQKLLGIEKIGIHDNFLDLGGHSLLGTQLITRLRDMFRVDLTLRTLLEEPTVANLAMVIVQKKAELMDDAHLLQDIEDIERLTDDEAQALLAIDVSQAGRE